MNIIAAMNMFITLAMNIIISVALIQYNLHNNYTNLIDRKYGTRGFTSYIVV